MKKRSIRIIVFILIFCVLFSIASISVVKVDSIGRRMITEFYLQPKNSLDGVYIGASTVFTSWNSLFAWGKYGISVYPYCCNTTPYYTTEFLIKEARKTQPDATFIVNLNSITHGEIDVSHMYNIINAMPMSLTKLELITYMREMGGHTGIESLEYYFPFVRFHSRWSEFYTGTKLVAWPTGYKGASVKIEYLNDSVDISSDYVLPDESVELYEKLIYSTDRLLEYCENEDVKILFVAVPQAREDINHIDTLASYISSKGYDVLNLIETADEEFNLDTTKDFFDKHHLNIHGSIKYTDYLSKYLIENYGFEDKRDDEDYREWNTAYEKYMAEIASVNVLDIELDYDYRDFDIEEPTVKVKAVDNTAEITWDSVKNVDGYKVYKKGGDSTAWTCISEISAKSDDLKYTDSEISKDNTYYYTVVPFDTVDGFDYYGDFNYSGVSLEYK